MSTEGLRVASEGVASFADIDRIMREQAGFRLGPFELLDLTALDVSHPVMESIYHQFYEEPRFARRRSPARGSRAGSSDARRAKASIAMSTASSDVPPEPAAPHAAAGARLDQPRVARRPRAGAEADRQVRLRRAYRQRRHAPEPDSLIVVTPLGFDVTTVAAVEHLDATRIVAIDTLFRSTPSRAARS